MLSLRLLSGLLWLAMLGFAVGVQNIQTFGAVPNDSSLSAADTNSKAIQLAFLAAQGGQNADERTVYVPSGGAGSFFFIHPVYVANFDDITFRIDGVLRASDDIANWPKKADNVSAANIFEFQNTTRFTITGNGAVDGQGYNWWVAVILKKIKDKRPHMFVIGVSQHLTISGINCFNSPQFHFKLDDVDQVDIQDMTIKVDVSKQRTLLESYGLFEKGLPTFPLNTDGIDPSGSNVYIRNVSIENYDDAVAVKPAHGGRVYAQCAENITVVDSYVRFGVGMTIGSVPPNSQVNCVRNVTFRNIVFDKPFKAIYIKTNPGSVGTGIISNILYENITVNDPIWWGIYIGPQQQKQPDGGGPGCMFYPLNKDCPTQPRVSIDHVTLRNVHIKGALLSPGILRCNESNPCTDFVFDNVTVDGWLSKVNFICENIQGVAVNSSYPIPACLKKQEFSD